MMADLDDSIREDLARLRALSGPSEAARRRMWAGLETRFDPGPDGGGSEGGGEGPGFEVPSTGGLAQVGFAAKVVAATVALTGAGLLGLRAGVVVVRLVAPGDPGEVGEATPAMDRVETITPRSDPEPPISASTSEATPQSAKPTAAARAERAKPGSRPVPADPAPVDSSLTAELALLQAAHDASSPEAALSALDEHRRSFPNGQLADERELMRLEALCTLGRLDAARVTAKDLLRRGDALAARAREVCPAIDE
jgi:hypothetical protein